jgi:hypothetical protein
VVWLAAIVSIGYRLHRSLYPMPALYDPEQWLETLSAVSWLVAGVLFARTAWLSHMAKRDRGLNVTAIAVTLAAIASFLCAGEELSWGQHLMGYATPLKVAAVNIQGEVNLHNLLARGVLDRVESLITVSLLAVALIVAVVRCGSTEYRASLQRDAGLLVLLGLSVYANLRLHVEVSEFVLPLAGIVLALQLGSRPYR